MHLFIPSRAKHAAEPSTLARQISLIRSSMHLRIYRYILSHQAQNFSLILNHISNPSIAFLANTINDLHNPNWHSSELLRPFPYPAWLITTSLKPSVLVTKIYLTRRITWSWFIKSNSTHSRRFLAACPYKNILTIDSLLQYTLYKNLNYRSQQYAYRESLLYSKKSPLYWSARSMMLFQFLTLGTTRTGECWRTGISKSFESHMWTGRVPMEMQILCGVFLPCDRLCLPLIKLLTDVDQLIY